MTEDARRDSDILRMLDIFPDELLETYSHSRAGSIMIVYLSDSPEVAYVRVRMAPNENYSSIGTADEPYLRRFSSEVNEKETEYLSGGDYWFMFDDDMAVSAESAINDLIERSKMASVE